LYYVDSDNSLTSLYPNYSFFLHLRLQIRYIQNLLKQIIFKFGVDVYIPLIDEELVSAKLEVEGFNNVKVLTPTTEFCELSLNKFKLMKVLSEKASQ